MISNPLTCVAIEAALALSTAAGLAFAADRTAGRTYDACRFAILHMKR